MTVQFPGTSFSIRWMRKPSLRSEPVCTLHTPRIALDANKKVVWLACTLSFILALPSLGSSVAFSAATSIATIGLYISYGTRSFCGISVLTAHLPAPTIGIPIALRVFYGKHFKRGPFHLGPFSYPVAIISCLWILFISIAFILPQANPVDTQTLNYAIVAVGIVATYALGFWLISARKWFTGPVKQITCGLKRIRPYFLCQS